MYKGKIVFVCVFLLMTTIVYGQDVPKTILWKVTKPGSKYQSYLFGTFHEVSPAFFDTLHNAKSKLQQSEVLFVEARSSNLTEAPAALQMQWNAKRWQDILTSEQVQIFTEFVHKAEDSSYYNLNPLLLALTTSRLYLTNFCNTDTALPELMDIYIKKLALEQNKPVYSLDGDQNALLNTEAAGFSARQDSTYAAYSHQFMKSMLENDLSGCQMIHDYKSFALDYQLQFDITQNPAYSTLLTERNNKWIKTLHQAFGKQNCFVAVGFKHLFYQQGLIQQLKKLGYIVSPIPAGK